uniref:2-C-methyl-D-erythritol 4-phosphate cytidylyltransferase n=1 Tax=Ningiella ruwaisensis TaxID=2364274 RepID=UPI0010A049D5|nr:2-C-methyl-D-erythritol 4-phosphate cytidylyltransferase [Ningiella ruwaisensis]
MESHSSVSVIIPAAGVGSRMGKSLPKQYLKIGSKTVIEHTLDTFLTHPNVARIVVCLSEKDTIFKSMSISSHNKIHQTPGGQERANSVLKGLVYLQSILSEQEQNQHMVFVHDAARPGLTRKNFDALIERASIEQGAILAMPVVDTIKLAKTKRDKATYIEKTVDRQYLWQAQTPQGFSLNLLKSALEQALAEHATITDEASAIEYVRGNVALVEGESCNFKITRPEDLALAEFYLLQQERL